MHANSRGSRPRPAAPPPHPRALSAAAPASALPDGRQSRLRGAALQSWGRCPRLQAPVCCQGAATAGSSILAVRLRARAADQAGSPSVLLAWPPSPCTRCRHATTRHQLLPRLPHLAPSRPRTAGAGGDGGPHPGAGGDGGAAQQCSGSPDSRPTSPLGAAAASVRPIAAGRGMLDVAAARAAGRRRGKSVLG